MFSRSAQNLLSSNFISQCSKRPARPGEEVLTIVNGEVLTRREGKISDLVLKLELQRSGSCVWGLEGLNGPGENVELRCFENADFKRQR